MKALKETMVSLVGGAGLLVWAESGLPARLDATC
jgi:hypothetical protein